ncbi:hypothetical protein [Methylobacterium sp. JK268]
MSTYVITEGAAEAAILRAFLAELGVGGVQVVEAGGKSSAISLGTSLALKDQARVAVIVDADTTDDGRIRKQQMIFRDLVPPRAGEDRCRLFLAVPTVEGQLLPTAAPVPAALDGDREPFRERAAPGLPPANGSSATASPPLLDDLVAFLQGASSAPNGRLDA